jgi:hypothetical protein
MSETQVDEAKKLKLFVVGESSGDPSTWDAWTQKHLVIAASKERAIALTDRDPSYRAAEVEFTEEGILMVDRC